MDSFSPERTRLRRRLRLSALAGVLALAALVRAWPWSAVFTPGGVRFSGGDDDPTYHVLRAERMLSGAPGAPWTDPGIDYPRGAVILWPPLFDAILVGAGWVAELGGPVGREALERGASVVPVVLGIATIPIIVALAATLAGEGALLAGLLVAVLPAHAVFSMVGRPDQHVLEVLLFAGALLAFSQGLRRSRGRAWPSRLALAVVLALSFWNWMGSGLYLLVLAGFVSAWFVVAPAGDLVSRRSSTDLAAGGIGGALLLGASLAVARGPGALRTMSLSSVTGFHALLLAVAGAFGAALSACAHRGVGTGRATRVAIVAAAGALALGAALLLPGFGAAVEHGLVALGKSNPWYQNIQEYDPALFAGWQPVGAEIRYLVALYGLTLVALPLAAVGAARRARAALDAAAPSALLLACAGGFLALDLARQRFTLYLLTPLAILVGDAWSRWTRSAAARLGGGGTATAAVGIVLGAALTGPALALIPDTLQGETPAQAAAREVLARIPSLPAIPRRPAVLAEWSYGHMVQYVAHRPVLVTPFGTEAGEDGMQDAAAVFVAPDEAQVESVLARREIGIFVLADPIGEVHFARAFVPGAPEVVRVVRNPLRGARVEIAPGFEELVVVRLFRDDGTGNGRPALGGFRLLDEGGASSGKGPELKVFGVVPGARLRVSGMAAGAHVVASVNVWTPAGRAFTWTTSSSVDASGATELRLPYATGANGRVLAGSARLSAGGRAIGDAAITEDDVVRGAVIQVAAR